MNTNRNRVKHLCNKREKHISQLTEAFEFNCIAEKYKIDTLILCSYFNFNIFEIVMMLIISLLYMYCVYVMPFLSEIKTMNRLWNPM